MQRLSPIVRLELSLILGRLDDKVSVRLSPGRVQLLVFTVMGAGYYLLLAIERAERQAAGYPEEAALLGISGGS